MKGENCRSSRYTKSRISGNKTGQQDREARSRKSQESQTISQLCISSPGPASGHYFARTKRRVSRVGERKGCPFPRPLDKGSSHNDTCESDCTSEPAASIESDTSVVVLSCDVCRLRRVDVRIQGQRNGKRDRCRRVVAVVRRRATEGATLSPVGPRAARARHTSRSRRVGGRASHGLPSTPRRGCTRRAVGVVRVAVPAVASGVRAAPIGIVGLATTAAKESGLSGGGVA